MLLPLCCFGHALRIIILTPLFSTCTQTCWYFIWFNALQVIGSRVDRMMMGLSIRTDQSGRSCLSLMHHSTGIWLQPYLSQTISSERENVFFWQIVLLSPPAFLQRQAKILPIWSWYKNTMFWNLGYAEQYQVLQVFSKVIFPKEWFLPFWIKIEFSLKHISTLLMKFRKYEWLSFKLID